MVGSANGVKCALRAHSTWIIAYIDNGCFPCHQTLETSRVIGIVSSLKKSPEGFSEARKLAISPYFLRFCIGKQGYVGTV